jgi:hypothetical protein
MRSGAWEFSTLDLCAFDAFTLIAHRSAAERWQELARHVAAGLPGSLKINVAVLEDDFELLAGREADEWVEGLHPKDGGGLLIRPD